MATPHKSFERNRVLKSLAPVIDKARHVAFDETAAAAFAQELADDGLDIPEWDTRHHYHDGTPRTVQYLFLLDSLNFCFWGEPRWAIEYDGETITGYNALAAALRRAVEHGMGLLDTRWMMHTTREELGDILEGNVEIPLLDQRAAIVREIGDVLARNYDGEAVNLVAMARKSAWRLADLLMMDFPSFRDVAYYGRHQVLFLKRAQIFCADLHGAFGGKKWGAFDDITNLTAFADYRLPQLLRQRGILFLSPDLADRIDNKELIPAGSDEEIEIRAMTINAVEVLRNCLEQRGITRSSVEIDWILWERARGLDSPPHHRTLTTYY